jgi:outer membrane protein OmpA-like peptidoglycan-associated protein
MAEVTVNALRNAPFVLAALALPLAGAQAKPSDVRAYSAQEATDLLNAPVESENPQAVCGPKEILLDNGTCAATRGFSLARIGSGNSSSAPAAASAPQLTTRPAQPRLQQYAPSGKPAAPLSAARKPAAAASSNVPLQFAVGSFELSAQSKTNLATLAHALNTAQHQGKRVRIVGHTDRSGKQETNLILSQKRADAVAEYLAGKGVDRSRIDTLGVADTAMIPGASPFSPRQRRVEITRVQ